MSRVLWQSADVLIFQTLIFVDVIYFVVMCASMWVFGCMRVCQVFGSVDAPLVASMGEFIVVQPFVFEYMHCESVMGDVADYSCVWCTPLLHHSLSHSHQYTDRYFMTS